MEAKYGRIIRGMAYPDSGIARFHHGMAYDKIKTYLSELEIAYARTTKGHGTFALPNDFYNWCPIAHHNDENLFELIDAFLSFKSKSTKA